MFSLEVGFLYLTGFINHLFENRTLGGIGSLSCAPVPLGLPSCCSSLWPHFPLSPLDLDTAWDFRHCVPFATYYVLRILSQRPPLDFIHPPARKCWLSSRFALGPSKPLSSQALLSPTPTVFLLMSALVTPNSMSLASSQFHTSRLTRLCLRRPHPPWNPNGRPARVDSWSPACA